MTIIEVRNAVVKELYAELKVQVRLSDQEVSESDYPYVFYQFVSPRMAGSHDFELEKKRR